MNYTFPATKFSRELSFDEQVAHVLSEADEVAEHGPDMGRAGHLELMDLLHSCESAIRILEREHGADYVGWLVFETVTKNEGRRYYDHGQHD